MSSEMMCSTSTFFELPTRICCCILVSDICCDQLCTHFLTGCLSIICRFCFFYCLSCLLVVQILHSIFHVLSMIFFEYWKPGQLTQKDRFSSGSTRCDWLKMFSSQSQATIWLNNTWYFVGLVYHVVIVHTTHVRDRRTTWKAIRAMRVELRPIVEQPQPMPALTPNAAVQEPDVQRIDEYV